MFIFFFFSSRRRHTRLQGDWSSDVCSSDLKAYAAQPGVADFLPDCGGIGLLGIKLAPVVGAELFADPKRGFGDRESGVEGKRVDLGGRRIIKKKKKKTQQNEFATQNDAHSV